MNTRQSIQDLFAGYEKTPTLADFMEEMEANLNDRIDALQRQGLTQADATAKALAELGDISTLADEMSLQRKQQVFSEAYMDIRHYMTVRRGALYAVCGLLVCAAALLIVVWWLAFDLTPAIVSAVLPFGLTGILGCVFLGLTQETATREPVPAKRAWLYVLAVALVFAGLLAAFGVITSDTVFAGGSARSLVAMVGLCVVLALPGIVLGAFLGLTESDPTKPWARSEAARQETEMFADPVAASRFGMICGALWIAAVAGVAIMIITVGIKLAWLPIVVALVVQMLVMAGFMKPAHRASTPDAAVPAL